LEGTGGRDRLDHDGAASRAAGDLEVSRPLLISIAVWSVEMQTLTRDSRDEKKVVDPLRNG
jgi:hypothetical protein